MFEQVIFNSEEFMPHGYCFLWQPELIWMHVISDLAIALAYFSIPITIMVIMKRADKQIPYKWVFNMFAIFIFFCGVTHLIGLITLWHPYYFLEGVIKVVTAAASVATAVMILPLVSLLIRTFSEIDVDTTEVKEHERSEI